MHSFDPFVDRIPAEEKQIYLDDFMQFFIQKCNIIGDKTQADCRYDMPYKLCVAYARKPWKLYVIILYRMIQDTK